MIDADFLKARIAKAKLIIVEYEDAILALSSGTQQSYTLNTGQTSHSVTKKNLASLENALASQENRLATLCARLYGAAGQSRPAW